MTSSEEVQQRWTRRPEGSTWGDWGPDDQLGRLNLLSPQKVLEGVGEVKEGINFCLSLPLDVPGGQVLSQRRRAPVLSPTGDESGVRFNFLSSLSNPHHTAVISDDVVNLSLQYSTQWDSLAHVGSEFDVDGSGELKPVYYNGFRAGIDIVGPRSDASGDGRAHQSYARRLGVENMAVKPIQGRAVLIDLEPHFGMTNEYVDYKTLREIMDHDHVVIEPGDMVVLHTGFATALLAMGLHPDPEIFHDPYGACAVLDGRDEALLQWITDSEISVIAADNYAVEGSREPPESKLRYPRGPLHHHCLFKLGMNLGELWYLGELATWLRVHGRNRFLLTAPPLRLPGAVGSPANPVATV